MSDLRGSSYLVSSTRLRDLFWQQAPAIVEELEQPARVGNDVDEVQRRRWIFMERSFRSDIDITTPDHLVSLGLTWSKMKELIRNEGRGNGVVWMGQDTYLTYLVRDHNELTYAANPHEVVIAPRGFRKLFVGRTEHKHEHDFDFVVCGTNPTSDSYGYMMNLLAEVISLEESIILLCSGSNDGTSVLHCPTTALERFVSEPTSERCLRFGVNLRLSNEHCRVLFSGSCSDKINLVADFSMLEDGGAVLIEAIRSSRCPAVLEFRSIELMPETRCVEFVGAMRNNESLKEIDVNGCSDQRMAVLLPALVAAKSLKSLSLRSNIWILNNDLWQHFWSLIAQNLSINHLDIRVIGGRGYPVDVRVQRDMCIVEALKTNTVLTRIEYSHEYGNHSQEIMQGFVLPMLEVNRFRPHIQAIRQVPNDNVRCWLVGKALLHPRVREHAAIRYLLMSVNSDLASFWVVKKMPGTRSHPSQDDEDMMEGTDGEAKLLSSKSTLEE